MLSLCVITRIGSQTQFPTELCPVLKFLTERSPCPWKQAQPSPYPSARTGFHHPENAQVDNQTWCFELVLPQGTPWWVQCWLLPNQGTLVTQHPSLIQHHASWHTCHPGWLWEKNMACDMEGRGKSAALIFTMAHKSRFNFCSGSH